MSFLLFLLHEVPSAYSLIEQAHIVGLILGHCGMCQGVQGQPRHVFLYQCSCPQISKLAHYSRCYQHPPCPLAQRSLQCQQTTACKPTTLACTSLPKNTTCPGAGASHKCRAGQMYQEVNTSRNEFSHREMRTAGFKTQLPPPSWCQL